MLLTSVIIVLREFLEAALIFSVLLALCDGFSFRRNWILWSTALGLVGAVTYAAGIAAVSDWFGGVGQEVINAFLQIAIYVCLVVIAILASRPPQQRTAGESAVVMLMATTVALAIAREGSEIILYLSGFAQDWSLLEPILLGGVVGAGIGISVGALAYYLLVNASRSWAPYLCIAVMILVAAGMIGQATEQLIQADWLPSQLPLWDTSAWVPESSVTGQLLYALVGYEATPTAVQVGVYFCGLLLPLIIIVAESRRDIGHA